MVKKGHIWSTMAGQVITMLDHEQSRTMIRQWLFIAVDCWETTNQCDGNTLLAKATQDTVPVLLLETATSNNPVT